MTCCVTEGCNRPVQARRLCSTHYSYWHRAQRKYTVTCVHCGTTANVARKDMKVCSLRCASLSGLTYARTPRIAQQKAEAQRRRQARSQIERYTGPVEPLLPAATHTKTTNRLTSGQCRTCSAWFVSVHADTTCSIECRKQRFRTLKREAKDRRRARKRDAYVQPVVRRRVFERDGYKCHLCKRKVDHTKPVPHPRAATIDHVIPLAQGGTHEPLNCRTCCFRCNSMKGDRGGGEQLLLIA